MDRFSSFLLCVWSHVICILGPWLLAHWFQLSTSVLGIFHVFQAFMLRRTIEESLGHAAAIVTDVLENAESSHLITASQKRALLQEMALRLS